MRTLVRLSVAAVAVAAALVLAACTSNKPSGASSPPSLSPVPSQTHTAGSPVPLPVALSKGSAKVRVTGGLKAKLTLPLGSSGAYARTPGRFSLSFIDRRGDALIVGGTTPSHRAKTSSALTLSLVVQGKKAYAFPSARGECTITVARATGSSFSVRFTCGKLSRSGKTIHATGTFQASR
jgi:hypothetical protein